MLEELTSKNFVDLDGKVSPAVLAGIVNCNVSLLYQFSQLGRLPVDFKNSTYRECIHAFISHYRDQVDIKLKRIEAAEKNKEKVRNGNTSDLDNGEMNPLVAAKLSQNIKTERAREYQIWEKIAIERGDYISKANMDEVIKPIITSIRDLLLSIASDNPELESKIDQGMEHLYNLGINIIDDSREDKNHFVHAMLETPIEQEIEMDKVQED